MIVNEKTKKMFSNLKDNMLHDEFSDEPLIMIYSGREDEYYEYCNTDSYMNEYCNDNSCIHLFNNDYHFAFNKNDESIEIFEVYHFNTSDYGLPSEYARDELHQGDDLKFVIKSNGFTLGKEQYTWSSEEEKFQLSCTELGFYIDVVDTIRETVLADIAQHGSL